MYFCIVKIQITVLENRVNIASCEDFPDVQVHFT